MRAAFGVVAVAGGIVAGGSYVAVRMVRHRRAMEQAQRELRGLGVRDVYRPRTASQLAGGSNKTGSAAQEAPGLGVHSRWLESFRIEQTRRLKSEPPEMTRD